MSFNIHQIVPQEIHSHTVFSLFMGVVWFNVHHNQFTGPIPSAMILEQVKIFDISGNKISGQIPFSFAETVVPNIKHLRLENNQLNGTVPANFVNLGRGRVYEIYLNDNQVRTVCEVLSIGYY